MTTLHNEKSISYWQQCGLKCKPEYSIEFGVRMVRNTNRQEDLKNLWIRADEYEDVLSELLATKQAYNNLFSKLSEGVLSEIRELKQGRLDRINITNNETKGE